jgi:CRISPR-associated RAMP protein (TIGR02581 family)
VRDYWERPYIPGSSLKGALRSAVERLIGGLTGSKVTSCQLLDGAAHCLTTDAARQKAYQALAEKRPVDETKLVNFLEGPNGLCDTCRLFGSPYSQARLLIRDLPLASDEVAASEIRHGVGIDRDTLTAREKIKYDFEALPSQLKFTLELVVERPSALDLALLALALQELQLGFVPLGGIRTRGLGRCQIELAEVQCLDLTDKAAVLAFLTRSQGAASGAPRRLAGQTIPATDFIQQHLATLTGAV